MTTQQHTSTAPCRNEYVGKHRPAAGHSWRPTPDYGDAPNVDAGVGLSFGVEPHLTLVDLTGGMVRIPLSPETVEHITLVAAADHAAREARYADQAREIEASLDREDRYFRTHERVEATS